LNNSQNQNNKIDKKEKIRFFFKGFTSAKFGKISKTILAISGLSLGLSFLEYNEIWIFRYHYNPFSREDYYWFFSTVAQALAALFGIGAMFTAYILQILRSNIKESENKAKMIFGKWGYAEIAVLSGEKLLSELIKYNKKEKYAGDKALKRHDFLILKHAEHDLSNAHISKEIVTGGVKNIFIFMSFIILMSFFVIPFCDVLSKLFFGLIFGISILVLVIITVLKLGRFILVAIKG